MKKQPIEMIVKKLSHTELKERFLKLHANYEKVKDELLGFKKPDTNSVFLQIIQKQKELDELINSKDEAKMHDFIMSSVNDQLLYHGKLEAYNEIVGLINETNPLTGETLELSEKCISEYAKFKATIKGRI